MLDLEELEAIVLAQKDEVVLILLKDATQKHGEASKQLAHWKAEESNLAIRCHQLRVAIERMKAAETANVPAAPAAAPAGGKP